MFGTEGPAPKRANIIPVQLDDPAPGQIVPEAVEFPSQRTHPER